MKNFFLRFGFVLALMTVIIAGCNKPDIRISSGTDEANAVPPAMQTNATGNPNIVASVTGAGSTKAGFEDATYFLNATKDINGNVAGKFIYNFRQNNVKYEVDITCLYIFPDGASASLSGVITSVTGSGAPGFPPAYVGNYGVFTVADNDQGANAPAPDAFSPMHISSTFSDCTGSNIRTFLEINGNIKIEQ